LTYHKLEKIYRPKLRRKDLIEQVLKIAKLVKVKNRVKVIKEHPADNKFLECAIAAKADYVVSGDKHVLKVRSYKQTKMLSVSDFLELIE
jgi:putative PIN family toxin of toxin-antitoxin system